MDLLGDVSRTVIGHSLDCPICGQHFTTAIRRQQHMTFHRPRNLMCYSCKNAEVQFPCYSAMVQHMMTGCGNVNSREIDWLVSCWYQWNRVMIPEVRRRVREKKELAPVAGYHLDKQLDKYFCTICDKVFKLEKGAQMHAASNIHSPNIYRCPACKGEFPSFGALLLHAESLKCSLVIKLDSTLAKLLHFLHLKIAPIPVEAVIKEDLGVLVSQVAPPQGDVPVRPAPVIHDLIDLTDIAEAVEAVEEDKTTEEEKVADGHKVIGKDKIIEEDSVIEDNQAVETIGSRTVSTESLTLVPDSRPASKTRKSII